MRRQESVRGEEPVRREVGLCARAAALLALAAWSALTGCSGAADPVAGHHAGAEAATAVFLAQHWSRPIAAVAAGAPGNAQLAALAPSACGACHAAQFADWQGSLHSRAMGPGVMGQLVVLKDPAGAEECTRCHAPLAEQSEALRRSNAARAPPGEGLHAAGLTCAGCHMRQGRIHGPPRRDGSVPAGETSALPHRGWTAAAAFEDSRFCATCHQFGSEGYALNGKLLENTYEEWRASPHAAQGRSCQDCHMPGRRHLWRGIHDPQMVRAALTIETSAVPAPSGELRVDVSLRNTGAGHHFPTYVTPKVFVEAWQEDAAGRQLTGTLRRYEIGRLVSADLGREIADTRIPAGGQAVFVYRAARASSATAVVLQLRVDPDAFYRGVYETLLASGTAGAGEASIRQALRDANRSGFIAWSSRVGLGKPQRR